MCGIVGLFIKDAALTLKLGAYFTPMLVEMSERGPDSAGFAIYRNPVGPESIKLTLAHEDDSFDWQSFAKTIGNQIGLEVSIDPVSTHAIMVAPADEATVRRAIAETDDQVRIVGAGHIVEIFKEVGLPEDVAVRFELASATGSHAIGHTRMATESAVTTAGSHPFATGQDLCLVHNGSLSNHNRLRDWLSRHAGLDFATENDTEVAAAYLTYRLRQGLSLKEALEAALRDLDGFYTFAVGTGDGFAVLRDPIACKPAVMAETDDWVAMASEYRSLAKLPGVEEAVVWEPEPATVYSWGHG